MKLQRYTPDVPEICIIDLAHDFLMETELGVMKQEDLMEFVNRPSTYLGLCWDEITGTIVGGLLGTLCDPPTGIGKQRAKDMALFVRPQYRGSFAAIRLIKDFEKWAKEKGCDVISLSQGTGINIERTAKFYESMGYTIMGFITKKVL